MARMAVQSRRSSLSNNIDGTKIADDTPTAEKASPAEKPKVERKQSIDPQAAQQLEKSLGHDPEKNELIERNILKGEHHHVSTCAFGIHRDNQRADDSVAPALQAKAPGHVAACHHAPVDAAAA